MQPSKGNELKPEKWQSPENKIFPHQVGFTCPPHEFDPAPTDFLRMSPDSVSVHGRILHLPDYAFQLEQRADNFHQLEEVVAAMSNAGADAVGQVGTNWVHCTGTGPKEIAEFCDRLSDSYGVSFHMAGMCIVEALRFMNVEKIAINFAYYWPDWAEGVERFLKQAGFDVLYSANFVKQGLYGDQQDVNDLHFIFPEEYAAKSTRFVCEQAPDADAVVVIGMPNWRGADGLSTRLFSLTKDIEAEIGKPVIGSDSALYWRLFRAINVAPLGDSHGKLLASLV